MCGLYLTPIQSKTIFLAVNLRNLKVIFKMLPIKKYTRKKIKLSLLLLIAFVNAISQDNVLSTIKNQFTQNEQNVLTEKIFTHTDKDFYLAGEIIWFKLYYTDGDNKPADLSRLAYVEIVDKELRSILQAKIELKEGTGSGSLYIPVSLNSGVYKLRTYTSWMKNFSADYFFEKTITIVNSLKSFETPPPSPRNYDIQFFPEGGNLVQGIESKVGFRVVDQYGKGVDCNGYIINQSRDTIERFQPLKFGLGHFNLTPSAGNVYKAIIKMSDTTITKELPAIYQQGYVMNISNKGSQLDVSINANISSGNTVYLLVQTRQTLKVAERGYITNGKAEFLVDKTKLGEGISNITIFNSDKQPVCERLYFIRPTGKLSIQSTSDQQQYATRKKVTVSINSLDEFNKALPAGMSLSVYKLDSLDAVEDNSIGSYFWLGSDLKGVESPGYYFSSTNAETDEALDNLMLTHGWRKFNWENILQARKPSFEFIPEWKGHIVTGRVIDIKTGLPASNINCYLSVPGSRVQLYAAESGDNGLVHFYTKDFYGPNEIVLETDYTTDSSHRIEIISPFSNKFSSATFPAFQMTDALANPILDKSISVQVQNSFSGDKLRQYVPAPVDSTAFFGKPDKKYLLDDYTRFSTMEEVLREYVYEVLVRRQKENFRLIMADGENKIFMDDPITLFNGVPVFETNKIMQYDPLKVKSIEVLKQKYFYGPLVLNGIVNFITYHPDPSMVSDIHSSVLDYEGLQYQREFFSPIYETGEQINSRLPDFRNVLIWMPEVKTNSQGKAELSFYTSDRKGKYIGVLQGMNEGGKFGSNTFSFEVK